MLARAALLSLSLCGLAGGAACHRATSGGSAAHGGKVVKIDNRVTIRFSARMKELPFDPRETRLRTASEQVGTLAGHAIEIVVDVAVMPEYEAAFHESLIEALSSLARDLDELSEDGAIAARYARYLPHTIQIEYDVTARRGTPYSRAVLDQPGRALTIPIGADSGLVPPQLLREVVRDAYADDLIAKFKGKEPRQVAAADHEDYFHYLDGHWWDLQTGKHYAEPEAEAIRKSLTLHELTRDADLRAKIRDRETQRVQSEYFSWYPQGRVTADGEAGDAVRTAKTYGAFVNDHLPELTAEQKLRVAKAIYTRGADHQWVADPFPGIDPFTFGLSVIDDWMKHGQTYEGLSGAERELTVFVVCHHGPHEGLGECRDEDFYQYAWSTERGRAKLATALMKRHSDKLVEATLYNLREPLELWRLVEKDRQTWTKVARVIGEEFAYRNDWIPSEVERLWRSRPADRGALLYLLAKNDPDGREDEVWDGFARRFGAAIGPKDLGAFLDFEPDAYALLDGPFRALEPGWSRAAVFNPRVDRLLSGDEPRYDDVGKLARAMCTGSTDADRAAVRSRIQRVVTQRSLRPSQVSTALQWLAPKGCE